MFSTFAYGEYPSKTWGFNYQPSPSDYQVNTFPVFIQRFNGYISLYNKFVDHSAQRINELQAYTSSIDRKTILMNTALMSHDGTITEISRRINTINSTLTSHNGTITEISRRVNAINSTLSSHDGTITELSRRINTINSTLSSHDGTITELSRRINTINTTLSSHAGSITVLTRRNTELGEVVGNVQRIVTSHDGTINTLSSRHNNLSDVVTNVQRIVTSHDGSINSLSSDLKTQTSRIDNVAKNVESVSNSVVSQGKRIDLLVASDVIINNKLLSQDKDIDRLNKTVIADSLITANLLSRVSKVEDFLSNLERLSYYFAVELTSVEGENSNEAEGSFVKLFKGQVTRLNKFNDDLNFKLRYSLIAEFNELKEALDVHFLETQNKIAEYGLFLNKNLETMNAWLKLLYEKPVNVEIPPITVLPANPFILDYSRLQKMFDGISFGSITNEAGKNIWDFLSDLVKALANVVESLSGLIGKIMDMLLKLIIPENPNFFSEKVKGTISTFDKKFKVVADLKDVFSNTMSSEKVKIPEYLEFVFMGNTVKAPLFIVQYSANVIRLPLTGFVLFEIFIYCYRKLTSADGGVID